MDYRGFYLELHRRMRREGMVPVTTYLSGARRGKRNLGQIGETDVFRKTFRVK